MSSAQPEDGLPVRRVITADSFRALKFKLSGARPAAAPADPASLPQPPAPQVLPQERPVLAVPVEPPAEPETVAHEPPAPLDVPEEEPLAELIVENAVAAMPEAAEPAEAEPPAEAARPEPAPEPVPETAPVVAPEPPRVEAQSSVPNAGTTATGSGSAGFIERRVVERPQPEDPEAGKRAHALLDIMAMPTVGSLPQERALANDTLLRLIPRMPLKSLRHLAERVCVMESPSQLLVRRLINDSRIEVSGPLLEQAMTVDDSDLIAVAASNNPAKLKLMARRRIISPALSEALIRSNHVETLLNLLRNPGAAFSIESMWRLTRIAAGHPVLQAPLVTRQDTPSPIAFQLFWQLPSELRRYVLSRFLTDSETISKILTMNAESDGAPRKHADHSLLSELEVTAPGEAGAIYAELAHVGRETGDRIAEDQGGEALTVALKAAGLTRAQFGAIADKRADAEALKAIFDTLSFNKARVLLTYWDWAARRTGPYARIAAA